MKYFIFKSHNNCVSGIPLLLGRKSECRLNDPSKVTHRGSIDSDPPSESRAPTLHLHGCGP